MKTVALRSICRPRQWPVISKKDMTPAGFVVYGANGPIGHTNTITHSRITIAVGCRGSCGQVHCVPADSYINGNAMSLDELDEKIVDIRYLFHWLSYRKFDDVISGSSQPQITQANIGRVEVRLPPLLDQQMISMMLDQADAIRSYRNRSLEVKKLVISAIYNDMFGNQEEDSANWPSLSDIVSANDKINYGVVQPGGDIEVGIPLLRAGDLLQPKLNIANLKKISVQVERAYQRSRLNGSEILIACVGSIGAVALATSEVQGFNIARAVARVPIDPAIADREFIAAQLKSNRIQRYFRSETRTVAQPTLNIKQIKEAKIHLPPLVKQREFSERVSKAMRSEAVMIQSKIAIDALFTSLQHRAFRGEL